MSALSRFKTFSCDNGLRMAIANMALDGFRHPTDSEFNNFSRRHREAGRSFPLIHSGSIVHRDQNTYVDGLFPEGPRRVKETVRLYNVGRDCHLLGVRR